MDAHLTFSMIRIAWMAWLLFWIWSARGIKSKPFRFRVPYFIVIGLGLVLLSLGPATPRFIPGSDALNLAAVTLTWIGVFLSAAARASIKKDHALVSTGPYRLVRNPSYSGILLAGIGFVLARGTLPALAGCLVIFAALVWKSYSSLPSS